MRIPRRSPAPVRRWGRSAPRWGTWPPPMPLRWPPGRRPDACWPWRRWARCRPRRGPRCWVRSPRPRGTAADGDYSPRSWLIHRTRITRGAAAGHVAWARRAAAHPQVLAALAEGGVSESYARTICGWSDKLPVGLPGRRRCDPGGRGRGPGRIWRTWPRWRPRCTPGPCPSPRVRAGCQTFEDRKVTVETTFGGAGVIAGDLTPECAAVVIIFSFRVSQGCDLRDRVQDSVLDAAAAA